MSTLLAFAFPSVWNSAFLTSSPHILCFPGGLDGKESACNAEDPGLIPGSGRFPRRRTWQPTPVFLPVVNADFPGDDSRAQGPKSGPEALQLHVEGTELGQKGHMDQHRCQDLAEAETRDWRWASKATSGEQWEPATLGSLQRKPCWA